MILMIQREHFAHQNVSWFDMCHTLNKICPFIRFGSNDSSVWRRNAEENTPTTTTITANSLIATFGLGWRINLAFCFYCILYVVESIADYCYEHRVYVGDFSCLFSHCHLICFCVRLICTNGVNFDRNSVGRFFLFFSSIHFRSLFIFVIFILFICSYWMHFERLFLVHEFSEQLNVKFLNIFNLFGGSIHCHFTGKQNWARPKWHN